MDVQIASLCDSAADYSGKLCLIGAFDTILVRHFPAQHPFCSVALRIVFRDTDEGKHLLRVNLIDDDGQNLLPKIEAPIDIRLPENQFFASVNLVFNLQGMRFTKPGQYSIDITVDGKMMARIPLQVLVMPEGNASH
ncbi:MAG: hypothetical protein EBS05_16010 [Proteobacteria bacterium]|jgi:hypothetical protein|nr:hypothetical protein [Pseudomonadota bacterium]